MRDLRTDVAHPARMYDFLLGGKDNYTADQAAAEQALKDFPAARVTACANRDFMERATGLLVGQGVRQFLDIGTGIPTARTPNLHEVVQQTAPDARVVYVDNDPVVLTHARALLTSGPEGRTDYIDADFNNPAHILEQAAKTLDFDEPIALCLVAILHFVADAEAYPIVRELMDALPPGSRLVLSHLTEDLNPENIRAVQRTYTERGFTFVLRSKGEVERFFTDNSLELAEPGVVPAHRWRSDGAAPVPEQPEASYLETLDPIDKVRYADINDVTDADINVYAAIGAKA